MVSKRILVFGAIRLCFSTLYIQSTFKPSSVSFLMYYLTVEKLATMVQIKYSANPAFKPLQKHMVWYFALTK